MSVKLASNLKPAASAKNSRRCFQGLVKPLEIPLKQWVCEQAAKEFITPNSMWYRLRRGGRHKYKLHERKINSRVILVTEAA